MRLIVLVACFVIVAIGSPAAQPNSVTPQMEKLRATIMEGLKLNHDQVSAAEKALVGSPDDLNARLKLLAHYSLTMNGDENFVKHLLWLVDHHPESALFGFGILQMGWNPPPQLIDEYRKHWEHAIAAHPSDVAVLSNAASIPWANSSFGVGLARKVLGLGPACRLDPACNLQRNPLGQVYGSAILRLDELSNACLPRKSDTEQTIAALRKEIQSVNDSEVLVGAGLTVKGESRLYQQKCGGNAEEANQFGMKLLRRAVALDPSVTDRYRLGQMLNQAP